MVQQQHDARYGGRALVKTATTAMASKSAAKRHGAKGFHPDDVVETRSGFDTPAGFFPRPYGMSFAFLSLLWLLRDADVSYPSVV